MSATLDHNSDMHDAGEKLQRRESPAVVAALLSVVLALLKLGAWFFTGSAAMLAAALDSLSDVLVSGLNALIIRAAGQPADEGHPFGHGKLEHLAGIFQALLIATSGGVAAWQGWLRVHDDAPLQHSWLGVGVALFSIAAALGIAAYLRRAARALRSPALDTDAAHYASDWIVNAGVLAAFGAELLLDSPWIDALVAGAVSLLILRTALTVFVDSAQSLMDRGLTKEELAEIHSTMKGFEGRIHGYHDLLTRRSGPDRFLQMHVEMDADVSLRQAHDLAEEIRAALEQALPGARVIIHLDPWPENTTQDPHNQHAPARKL
ncbi:MAG: cation transporter [Planctomycetes bacterium]|nr:cation transporter [Planctomycetota bacterium]